MGKPAQEDLQKAVAKEAAKEALKRIIQSAKSKDDLIGVESQITEFGEEFQNLLELLKAKTETIATKEEKQKDAEQAQAAAALNLNNPEDSEKKKKSLSLVDDAIAGIGNVVNAVAEEVSVVATNSFKEKFDITDNAKVLVNEGIAGENNGFFLAKGVDEEIRKEGRIVDFNTDAEVSLDSKKKGEVLFTPEGKIEEKESFASIAGLKEDASSEDFGRAFRRLTSQYQPSKFKDEGEEKQKEAAEIFQKITDAYNRYKEKTVELESPEIFQARVQAISDLVQAPTRDLEQDQNFVAPIRDHSKRGILFTQEGKIREGESFNSIAGLSENATQEEVRSAYKKLSLQYHPDKNLDRKDEATSVFQAINESFNTVNESFNKSQAPVTVIQNGGMEDEPSAATKMFRGNGDDVVGKYLSGEFKLPADWNAPQTQSQSTPLLMIEDVKIDLDEKTKAQVSEVIGKALEGKEKIYDAIKIDEERSQKFAPIAEIFADSASTKTPEEKLQTLASLLEKEGAKDLVGKDSSFGVFAKTATEVLAVEGKTLEEKSLFLENLSKSFGYLAEPVADISNKEAEACKITKAYVGIEGDKNFGEIVANNFRDAFKDSVSAAVGSEASAAVKQSVVDPVVAKGKEEDLQAPAQSQNQDLVKSATEEEKGKGFKEIIENITTKDAAIIGATGAASIALIVCLPGVGALMAIGLMYAASTQLSGEKDHSKKEAVSIEEMSFEERAEAAKKFNAQNVTKAAGEFVEENSKEVAAVHKSLTAAVERKIESETTQSIGENVNKPVVEEVKEKGAEVVEKVTPVAPSPQIPEVATPSATSTTANLDPSSVAATEQELLAKQVAQTLAGQGASAGGEQTGSNVVSGQRPQISIRGID